MLADLRFSCGSLATFSAKVEQLFPMSWTETFHCEICGKQKGNVDHWWLAWTENYRPPYDGAPIKPILKIYPWENMSAHDAEVKHLCGQSCLQTLVARWMNRTISGVHEAKASA
jgi:hypothetical protein